MGKDGIGEGVDTGAIGVIITFGLSQTPLRLLIARMVIGTGKYKRSLKLEGFSREIGDKYHVPKDNMPAKSLLDLDMNMKLTQD